MDVLKRCQVIAGNKVKLPDEKLDRKLYEKVAKALNGIGGKWKGGKVQAFEFGDLDPEKLLAKLQDGEKLNIKKDFQFFETPREVVEKMIDMVGGLQDGDRILEPSAGRGAICDIIVEKQPKKSKMDLVTFELFEENVKILQKKGFTHSDDPIDFLKVETDIPDSEKFTKIIANPPFTKNQDIEHVYQMYKLLAPGGILVSVTSTHWTFADGKKEEEFRNWIDSKGGSREELPRGTFSESGTEVPTCIVVISKPKKAPTFDLSNAVKKESKSTFEEIPVKDVVVMKNTRQRFDEADLNELAKSIAEHGLIQPITVTKKNGNYELVAGERRLRAVKILNWNTIPASIQILDNEDEKDHIRIIENLQRKNINPYDEYLSFNELINNGRSVEEISDSLGKSTRYIYDRLNLSTLCDRGRNLLINDTITISHALQIARLTHQNQQTALDFCVRKEDDGTVDIVESVNSLKRHILNNLTLDLNQAIFDTKSAKLYPDAGACTKCPKRSGFNTILFEDITGDDVCFDKDCFFKKRQLHFDSVQKDWENKGYEVVRVTNSWINPKEAEQRGIVPSWEIEMASEQDQKDFDIKRIALVVDGHGTGIGQTHKILSNEQKAEKQAKQQKAQKEKATAQVDEMSQSEKEEMFEVDYWQKFLELIMPGIVEKYVSSKNIHLSSSFMRMAGFILWKSISMESSRNIIKTYDWKIKEGDKEVNHSGLNYNNVGYFFAKNCSNLTEREMYDIFIMMVCDNLKDELMFDNDKESAEFSLFKNSVIPLAKELKLNIDEFRKEAGHEWGIEFEI